MNKQFWFSFLTAAVLTAAMLSAAGSLVAWYAAPPPPERFISSVFEFDLPKDWTCIREGTETICRSDSSPKSAVCILTMKYRGPNDTPEAYTKHLSTPKESKSRDGSLVKSEVVRVGNRQIKGYTWITGLHFQSEVTNYFTEYLAVVTSHVAVLITFSAHKDSVEKHRMEFETMISTLRVHQQL
ncbi:MAG: hypothetical protein EPO06_05425 [Burkholderiaceae bacterium]|nr:MAG: hypothetical protein EPO06_05425 [Burkholderiaceae bacterium]